MIRIRTLAARWPLLAAVAAAAAALATGACSETRPFERENTGPQARLSVPPGTERVREERGERARQDRGREYAENPDKTIDRIGRTTQPRGGMQYWLQVGAHRDEATSRAEWQRIQSAADAVFAVGHRIQRADLGTRGTFYRIQLGPFASAAEAAKFCAQLKARSIECFMALPEPAARTHPPGDTARTPPAPPPAAKPSEARTKPATVQPKPPAEKPKDTATAAPKKPETAPEKPEAKPETKPPPNASAEKPDVPISTAPGLPGVLD